MPRPVPTVALVLACLLILQPGCAGPPEDPGLPSWVVDPGRHPAAPGARFLTAVGSAPGQGGDALQSARAKALLNLSTALTVQVVGEIELESRSRTEDGATTWTDELVERARIQGAEELPGVAQVAAFHDPRLDETHALYAVERQVLRDLLLDEVARGMQAVLAANGRADAMQSSAPGRALQARLEAWQASSDAYSASVRAWVAGNADGPSTQARRQAAEVDRATRSALDEMLSALRFIKVSGDDQLGHPRGALAERLHVRVEYVHADGSSAPVPDLPVRFVSEAALTLAPSAATTDVRGEISCSVSDLPRAGLGDTVVTALLDSSTLAPALPPARLPRARFLYRLPTPANTRLLVDLRDSHEGVVIESDLAARVRDHLSAAGFTVQAAPEPLVADVDDLAERWGPTFDYVLRGGARVRNGSTQRSLQYLHLDGEIEVIALATGQVSQIVAEATGAGPDTSPTSAAQAVSRFLVATLLDELDARFVADFSSEPAR